MRKECPNIVPQSQAVRIELMQSRAQDLTIGQMLPCWLRQEKSGLSGPARTTQARFCMASIRQMSPSQVIKTVCVSPGFVVLAEGSSRHRYCLLFMSYSMCVSRHLRCFNPLKDTQEMTETSLKRIMPQNAQTAIAHTQASKGELRLRVALRAHSI